MQPYQPAYVVYARPTNGLAVVSLVMGILSWCLLPLIGAAVAVFAGHAALSAIRRSGEGGQGLATAGLILGWLQIGPVLLLLMYLTVAILQSIAFGLTHPH